MTAPERHFFETREIRRSTRQRKIIGEPPEWLYAPFLLRSRANITIHEDATLTIQEVISTTVAIPASRYLPAVRQDTTELVEGSERIVLVPKGSVIRVHPDYSYTIANVLISPPNGDPLSLSGQLTVHPDGSVATTVYGRRMW